MILVERKTKKNEVKKFKVGHFLPLRFFSLSLIVRVFDEMIELKRFGIHFQ